MYIYITPILVGKLMFHPRIVQNGMPSSASWSIIIIFPLRLQRCNATFFRPHKSVTNPSKNCWLSQYIHIMGQICITFYVVLHVEPVKQANMACRTYSPFWTMGKGCYRFIILPISCCLGFSVYIIISYNIYKYIYIYIIMYVYI